MTRPRMHADEVETDVTLVRRLLVDQFPEWAELRVDDPSWLRGRGWALYQAVSALGYYWDTTPGMVRQASHALGQVLAEGPPHPPSMTSSSPPGGVGPGFPTE